MSTTTSSTGISVASVDAIRSRFPALERLHAGLPVAYFDGPGGTQVPREVGEAMTDYLYRHNANTHWHYPSSAETDAAIEAARHALADYLGGAPEEVAFGANMTSLTYHLSRALGRGWGHGDEIVVTELDHHANSDPWRALAVERGVTIRVVPLDPATGELVPGAVEAAVSKMTRLVAIGAASNALGTINDVRAICALAKSAGALSFVDAVHFAAHQAPDVAAIGCDFLACSPYKFYGPHLGVLWARRALIDALDVPRLEPAPDWAPERLETGTLSHEGIVGAAAAVDFLANLASSAVGEGGADGERRRAAQSGRRAALEATFHALHERARALFARLWDGLGAIRGVTRYGPPPGRPRTPTVSFVVAGRGAHSVAEELARRAVFASSGDFYALTVARRLGHESDGLVRAGIAAYTTEEEVDRLLEGVAAAAGS
jgi:cysteine desulfurase family protein (TIGR01976 family)